MTPYCSTIPMEDNDRNPNKDNSYSNYIGNCRSKKRSGQIGGLEAFITQPRPTPYLAVHNFFFLIHTKNRMMSKINVSGPNIRLVMAIAYGIIVLEELASQDIWCKHTLSVCTCRENGTTVDLPVAYPTGEARLQRSAAAYG
jgi:hypothetical protein